MSKQSITVVRDWHPVRRAVAAGAMSVVLASAMALPAFAAESVTYATDGGDPVTKEAQFTDAAAGISWDGADAITLKDANLDRVGIQGDAIVQLEGESTVGSISSAEGDLTLNGNVEVPAEEKPILNIEADAEYADGIIIVGSYDDSWDFQGGNLTISGLTVNFRQVENWIWADNITIDNSKLAVTDVEGSGLEIDSEGTTDIVESVVDLGTGGNICSRGVLTINNSDVSVRADEWDIAWVEHSDEPYSVIHSHTDVVLTSEANGEVKYYTDDWDTKYVYVDTGDKTAVFLKAASTPGYYTGKQAEAKAKAMPKTGDAAGGVVAGLAAAAVAALGALGVSRRRGQSEE